MNIIVASIGASGSRFVRDAIASATGMQAVNDDHPGDFDGKVRHTHRAYDDICDTFGDEWRAVYIYGDFANAINAFYEMRNANLVGFRLMGIDADTVDYFAELRRADPIRAWLYMIKNDRLGWRRNLRSWRDAPRTIVMTYEQMCDDPERCAAALSEWIDCQVVLPEIRPRKSDWRRMPTAIKTQIRTEYDDLAMYTYG